MSINNLPDAAFSLSYCNAIGLRSDSMQGCNFRMELARFIDSPEMKKTVTIGSNAITMKKFVIDDDKKIVKLTMIEGWLKVTGNVYLSRLVEDVYYSFHIEISFSDMDED